MPTLPDNFLMMKYLHPRVLSMLFFGISAGIPYLLVTSTFYQLLNDYNLSIEHISYIVLLTLPYSLKVLWSHWIENLKIPLLHRLGQYRSWFILSQLGVLVSLILLGYTSPEKNLNFLQLIVFCVSFFSATQDMTLGAYRVHVLTHDQQSFGSSNMVIGYRLGILLAGSGALWLSNSYSWSFTYLIMAIFQIQGIITVLINPEPQKKSPASKIRIKYYDFPKIGAVLYREFFKYKEWWIILTYIFLYKFSDATLNAFTWTFLGKCMAFSKSEIAFGAMLGFFTNTLGAILGAYYIHRLRILKSLKAVALLQFIFFGLILLQSLLLKNYGLMVAVLIIENFVCGFGSACLYTFFSYIVSKRFTAIQYTFFSSFASFAKIIIVSLGGILVYYTSWSFFFMMLLIPPFLSIGLISLLRKSAYKKKLA